ncbi:hypothetical protein ACWKWJ_12535 [Sphingopyxis terrae subsp. ummariensis]
MTWLQENWIIAVVGLVVAVVLLWWLFGRKRPDEAAPPAAMPAEPKKPLEAAKPDIVKAEPARFKPKESAPASPPPPPAAPPTASDIPAEPPVPPAPAPAAQAPEPEPAAPPPVAPAPPAESAPAPAAAKADNLQLLKGVGPKMATLLGGLGVTSFAQIAAWTDADIAAIDPQLGAFQGRIARDNIVDQAGYLAKGDKAGFEAKYGALGGEL